MEAALTLLAPAEMAELHAELARLQEELAARGVPLEQRRAEGTRQADTITGWQEAFAAAQAELDTLRTSTAAAQQHQQTVSLFMLFVQYSVLAPCINARPCQLAGLTDFTTP